MVVVVVVVVVVVEVLAQRAPRWVPGGPVRMRNSCAPANELLEGAAWRTCHTVLVCGFLLDQGPHTHQPPHEDRQSPTHLLHLGASPHP